MLKPHVSSFRDAIPPERRGTYDAAIARAACILAAARRERDELAATGGPEAVAKAAYVPGGPSREEITATYRRLRDAARKAVRVTDGAVS